MRNIEYQNVTPSRGGWVSNLLNKLEDPNYFDPLYIGTVPTQPFEDKAPKEMVQIFASTWCDREDMENLKQRLDFYFADKEEKPKAYEEVLSEIGLILNKD